MARRVAAHYGIHSEEIPSMGERVEMLRHHRILFNPSNKNFITISLEV